jgi:hypothetical protein
MDTLEVMQYLIGKLTAILEAPAATFTIALAAALVGWQLKGWVSRRASKALREQIAAQELWRKRAEDQARIASLKVEKADQQIASLEARLGAADGERQTIVDAIKAARALVRDVGRANAAVQASLTRSPSVYHYYKHHAKGSATPGTDE